MLKTSIIGASGYTGVELSLLAHKHPKLKLADLYVSANSLDAQRPLSQLYAKLTGVVDTPLLPLEDPHEVAAKSEVVFLATAHETSHELVPIFLASGCQVFDLSGSFRVNDSDFYRKFYGFEHQYLPLVDDAAYGLAEWYQTDIKNASLVAVAGCYATASQLAIKPLIINNLLDLTYTPVINAVSGVSGAGRKASLTTSFCEVGLQPYGIFSHRHQPEMAQHLGCDLIFTPHLGCFKRGILSTTVMKLAKNVTHLEVQQAFENAYLACPAIRLKESSLPSVQEVESTPYCDIGWRTDGEHIIVISALDNLLKGASSQAMQCLNIHFSFPEMTALF